MDLKAIHKIHFIGIGGIMMSALAKYFLACGKKITGSDQNELEIIDDLIKKKVQILIGHKKENLPLDTDLVIYTVAIKEDNPELKEAKRLGISSKTVYQALGLLSEDKYTITISGMHGKTTTTALSGLILEKAGLDPTVFIGSKVREFKGNLRIGKSKYFVSEACEYQRNFLEFKPKIAILTNIEKEHLDYYKNLDKILSTFKKFVQKLSKDGFLIVNKDDENVMKVVGETEAEVIYYTTNNNQPFDLAQGRQITNNKNLFKAYNIKENVDKTLFDLLYDKDKKISVRLKIPGIHNVYNALASFALAYALEIDLKIASQAVENFAGCGRRFEYKGKINSVPIIDDYAHHPTEIKATLNSLKIKYPKRKIWLIFQPHLYSRTKFFLDEFAKSLRRADEVIITDIYAAREKDTGEISSQDLTKETKKYQPNTRYMKDFDEIVRFLKENIKSNDLIITMGAGDVYKVADKIKRKETSAGL